MNKVEEQIENTIEVICEACMPYICTYWEMEPTVRLKQCKPLRDWIDRIITDDLALIDQTCYTYPETGKKLAYVIPLKEESKNEPTD